MLTIIGRAAARRAVMPTMTTTLPLRPVQQARTFITTPVVFEAAESADKPKSASGEKKTAQKSKPGPGRPKKGDKRKPRGVKKTDEELEASFKKAAERRSKTNQKRIKQAAKDKNLLLTKQAMLDAPTHAQRVSANAYNLYASVRRRDGDNMSTVAEKWKAVPAAEKEALQEQAQQQKDENRLKYHTWLESQPVEVIALANEARQALNAKRTEAGKKAKYLLFDDPRLPERRILSPYNLFIRDQTKGYHGPNINERLTSVSRQWQTMTDEERKPYVTIWEGEREKTLRHREELAVKVNALRETYKADPDVPEDAESA